MRRKDLQTFTPEQAATTVVVVQRVEQYRRWRVVINGEVVVTADEIDALFADLERIAAWLEEAGIKQFTVRTHESS
ncbi:hypothetical protein AWB80_07459 [Caballeronia pedi]|uniref:Uncharacterized protein n=1 Tax=Caballeronia pedi TaxID=1777141 RepID=A0A158DV83_9BURK|nr:hypothetical protein [Caballeronia pedi]SAK98096.1 hypothetical protein AWB80_07459 [Caballeronia pedi]